MATTVPPNDFKKSSIHATLSASRWFVGYWTGQKGERREEGERGGKEWVGWREREALEERTPLGLTAVVVLKVRHCKG